MELKTYSASDIGQQRKNNEDNILVDPSINLYIVCDGMGGHAAGEVASYIATEQVKSFLKNHKKEIDQLKKQAKYTALANMAREAIQKACSVIFKTGEENIKYKGMGTTITLLWVIGHKAIMAHVGDSRLYVVRGSKVYLLSNDHTVQNERKFKISSAYAGILTRCLGTRESTVVDVLIFDVLLHDIYLLCSDGLSNYLESNKEIMNLIDKNSVENSGQNLIRMANDRGGRDNISVILIKVQKPLDLKRTDRAEKIMNYLQRLPLLKNLRYNQIIRFRNSCKILNASAGEILVKKGKLLDRLYILLEGELLVHYNTTTTKITPSQYFGEENLVQALISPFTVKCSTDVKVLEISQEDFQNLLLKFPKLGNQIAMNLLDHLSEKYVRPTGIKINFME